MSLIGALRISLGMESASFEKGAKRSAAEIDALGDRAEQLGFRVGRATKAMIGLATVVAGSAFVAGLKGAVTASLDLAGGLGEAAQQIGVTVRELQVLRYAAMQAGVAQEEMDGALAKGTKALGQAALGAAAPKKAFDALGVSVRDTNGHVKTIGVALPEIAERLSKIPDPAQRAAAEVAIFGRTGQKLDTILTGGKKGLEDYGKAAEEAGLIIGDDLARKADDAADKVEELTAQLKVSFAKEVAANADAILGLASALGALTVRAVQFINKHPQLVGALAGAAVGARVAGAPGAALGAVGGAVVSDRMGRAAADSNMDLAFRTAELQKATRRANEVRETADRPRTRLQRMGITPDYGVKRGDAAYNAAKAELTKQQGLMRQAMAAAPKPVATAPVLDGEDLPDFLASGGGGKKKKGKTAEQLAREAERQREEAIRRQKGFDDAAAKLDDELLDAKRDATEDYHQIAEFARQQAEAEYAKTAADIEAKRQLGDYTELQAAQLTGKAKEIELQKIVNINAEEAAQKARDALAVMEAQADTDRDLLAAQESVALTAGQRRDLQLRMLDLDKQIERAKLDEVIHSQNATAAEKLIAEARLKQLDAIYQGRAEVIKDQTRSPLEDYAKRKARTPEQLQEQAEQLVVDRLDSVEKGISQALADKLGVGDDPLITGLIDMLLDEILFRPLAEALRNGKDGMSGGGGGFFGSLLSGVFGSIGKIFGFAEGTPYAPRGLAVVGERGPELVNLRGGERIWPNGEGPALGGRGGNVYHISGNLLTPEFWAQIQRMDAAAAQAGSDLAQRDLAWGQSRRIGG